MRTRALQHRRVDRLGDVVDRAELEALDLRLRLGLAGEEDDRDVGGGGLRLERACTPRSRRRPGISTSSRMRSGRGSPTARLDARSPASVGGEHLVFACRAPSPSARAGRSRRLRRGLTGRLASRHSGAVYPACARRSRACGPGEMVDEVVHPLRDVGHRQRRRIPCTSAAPRGSSPTSFTPFTGRISLIWWMPSSISPRPTGSTI